MIHNLIKGFTDYIQYLMSKGVSMNESKLFILKYLDDNKDVSISDISRDLNMDYKNTWRYIKQFEKAGIVKLEMIKYNQGRKVLVKVLPIKK